MPTPTIETPKGATWLWGQFMLGASGFSEPALVSTPGTTFALRWGHPSARRLRYEIFWAHYEANVYARLHVWAQALKSRYQAYEDVRSVQSPAYRIVEFWAEHVWAGALDPAAGDGVKTPSALPIVTDNPAVRDGIARLWKDSVFQAHKDNAPRFGAALGDVGLIIDDDPYAKKVYLRVLHPAVIEDVTRDSRCNVKGYCFTEMVPDPRVPAEWAVARGEYAVKKQTAYRYNDTVVYETFLDNDPYDFRTYSDPDRATGYDGLTRWTENYGFVPLVLIPNKDVVGNGWGWSELQATQGKIMELDGLASTLDDQIHKIKDTPYLFAGVKGAGDLTVSLGLADDDPAEDENPPSRYPALFAKGPDVTATPLVSPMDVAAVGQRVADLLRHIESQHPEILADVGDLSGGNVSGEAISKAREKVQARVAARRIAYDDGLVRAQQMALSMGGLNRYPGYEAFGPESYANGDLGHAVGDRPVFSVDPMSRLAEARERAAVCKALTDGGWDLESAQEQAGYPPEVIAKGAARRKAADAAKAEAAKQQQAAMLADQRPPAPVPPGKGRKKTSVNVGVVLPGAEVAQ